jgi:hypothetical protein
MLGAISQTLSGLNTGFERLDKAASRIARDGAGDDLSDNMVELMRADHEVRANIAVLRTANATIGTLLSVMA